MDERDTVFTVKCSEREGEIVRNVTFAPLTIERLSYYWKKLSQFPTLFNRHVTNFEDFASTFVSQESNGNLKANGLIWEVDDVGVIWLTDIYPEYQATGHFTFWDRRFRGREPVVRRIIRYFFDEFNFHRIVCEVPLYSHPTMVAVERVGFVKEGRLRKAAWYRDDWWDVNLYSILKEDSHGLPEAEDRDSSAEDPVNGA